MEHGGEDTGIWAGGEEMSPVGGMLAVGKVGGTEVAVTAETGSGGRKAWG